jgi:amidophosphoribosyltransferase
MAVIQLKANVIESAVRGRKVLLVDDSIISGTTLRLIAKLLKEKGGALGVHAAVVAPPLRRQCPCGVKMPPASHMIFNAVPPDNVKRVLELNGLTFLSWQELEGVFKELGFSVCTLCTRA